MNDGNFDEDTPAESVRAIKIDEFETLKAMVAMNNRDQQEGFRALGLAFGRLSERVDTRIAELTAASSMLNNSVKKLREEENPPFWFWPLLGSTLGAILLCAAAGAFVFVRKLHGGG